jgi:hypothetical protein
MSDAFLNIPTRTVVKDEVRTFEPDYKYASPEDIKNVTVGQLAKLEVDLHSLRMAFVANGENPNTLVAQNRTIGDEISKVESALAQLENYFASVL